MPSISIYTHIQAPIQRVFDLCRSVEVHVRSTSQTQERAISGVTTGLLSLNDVVTWEATHLGYRQTLTSQITIYAPPFFFRDQMIEGAFQSFTHNHYFCFQNDWTIVQDQFKFDSPLGILGVFANQIYLAAYMRHFLEKRMSIVKRIAESDEWQKYL